LWKELPQAALVFATGRVAAPGRVGTSAPTVTLGISDTDGTSTARGACLGRRPNIFRNLDVIWNGLCTVKCEGLNG